MLLCVTNKQTESIVELKKTCRDQERDQKKVQGGLSPRARRRQEPDQGWRRSSLLKPGWERMSWMETSKAAAWCLNLNNVMQPLLIIAFTIIEIKTNTFNDFFKFWDLKLLE